MSLAGGTVLSSLHVANMRPEGWKATEVTSEEWPHRVWVHPGFLGRVAGVVVWVLRPPEVPHPGRPVHRARHEDSLQAGVRELLEGGGTATCSVGCRDIAPTSPSCPFRSSSFCPVSTLNCITFLSPDPGHTLPLLPLIPLLPLLP